jgi:hypothetical protein
VTDVTGVAIPKGMGLVFDRSPLYPGDSHASVHTGSE